MFLVRKALAGLCLLFALTGCGGASTPVPLQTRTGQYQTLQLQATSRTTYKRGQSVSVTLVVTNTGTQTVTYPYGGCTPNEAQVLQSGQVVATFDDTPPGEGCTADIKTATFTPGQTRTFTQVWDQQISSADGQSSTMASAGNYQIVSGLPIFVGNNIMGAAPLTITIQ